MRFYLKYITLLFGLCTGMKIFSQNHLDGLISDAATGDPVPFAVIMEVNSKKACTSGEDGFFRIFPETFPAVLQVSSMGFNQKIVNVSLADTFVHVLLEPANLSLNEVNVYAGRSGMQASSLESLKTSESYNLAGTTKDIFRSVQMLPGVTSNNAASARYNVRGGTYDENLVLINGIEVAEPYHIKVFPMASVGIFNIDLVQRIDFSAGGFSAEYGDALSSVLNVEYRKANNDSLTGRVSMGMIDIGLVSEIPLGKKLSLLLAARRSYLDPIVKIVQPKEKISIRYYDVQSKLDYEINTRNKISLLAVFSEDMDKVGPETGNFTSQSNGKFYDKPILVTRNEQNYYLLDARYNDALLALSGRHIVSGKLILNSEFSFYNENENIPQTEKDSIVFGFSTPELFNRVYRYHTDIHKYKIKAYEFKVRGKIRFSQGNNTKTGLYIRRSEFDYNNTLVTSYSKYNNTHEYPDTIDFVDFPSDPDYNNIHVFKADAYKYGGFVNHLLQVNPKLAFNLGIRTDYLNINKQLDISPRLGMSYNFSQDLKLIAAWGIFYKSPMMKQLKFSYVSIDNTNSQKATHYLLGIEKKEENSTIKAEVYYKKYDDLIPLRRTPMSRIIYDVKENIAEGYAVGIDLQYVLSQPKFDIWFNYSLASSKERLKGNLNYYSRYTDQRHTISSLFLLKMRHKNEFSTKLSYGSGYAFEKKFYDATNHQWLPGTETKTDNLPYFLSLDLRFKKEFRFFKLPAQFYADVINCLNRKNSIGHNYRIIDDKPVQENFEFYGVVPTFGIMVDF